MYDSAFGDLCGITSSCTSLTLSFSCPSLSFTCLSRVILDLLSRSNCSDMAKTNFVEILFWSFVLGCFWTLRLDFYVLAHFCSCLRAEWVQVTACFRTSDVICEDSNGPRQRAVTKGQSEKWKVWIRLQLLTLPLTWHAREKGCSHVMGASGNWCCQHVGF